MEGRFKDGKALANADNIRQRKALNHVNSALDSQYSGEAAPTKRVLSLTEASSLSSSKSAICVVSKGAASGQRKYLMAIEG
jgi:hypothetical protein